MALRERGNEREREKEKWLGERRMASVNEKERLRWKYMHDRTGRARRNQEPAQMGNDYYLLIKN